MVCTNLGSDCGSRLAAFAAPLLLSLLLLLLLLIAGGL
jgi:hypothetical protein